jgi:SRSO17 transposase
MCSVRRCQIGTFLAYVARAGHALIDQHLYLPESWTSDPDRCRQAGIPDDAELLTKPRVALDMLQRAIDAQVPFQVVANPLQRRRFSARHRSRPRRPSDPDI